MFHIFKKKKGSFLNVPIPSITAGEKWAKSQPKHKEITPVSPKTTLLQPILEVESNRLEEMVV
jgi:hypothetical protein